MPLTPSQFAAVNKLETEKLGPGDQFHKMEVLRKHLKALRQGENISLREMSKLSGLNKTVICKFESGYTLNPTLKTLYRYCLPLGLTINLEIKVSDKPIKRGRR